VLDKFTAPAIMCHGRMEMLAVNHLGRGMHSLLYDRCTTEYPNFARYTFLDEDFHRFYSNWDEAANICVLILRTEAGPLRHREPIPERAHGQILHLFTRGNVPREPKDRCNQYWILWHTQLPYP
jgi:transcription regulator MmyB-like protein